ncbi:hypothetical protein PG997_012945 [Apiospora hydei]|uniref:Uncharacterized protein n=1 Tax=Apiospora hydei TaxID=1337664 RepID=A0ABR1V892_9PEZI
MQLLQNNEQEQASTYSLPPSDRAFYTRDSSDAPNRYDALRASRKCIVSRRLSYLHVTQAATRGSSQAAAGRRRHALLGDTRPAAERGHHGGPAVLHRPDAPLARAARQPRGLRHRQAPPRLRGLTAALRENVSRSVGHYTRLWSALIRISLT